MILQMLGVGLGNILGCRLGTNEADLSWPQRLHFSEIELDGGKALVAFDPSSRKSINQV